MPDTAAPAATAFRAVAGVIVRHAITALGTALVAHGYLDQQTADSATGPIAEYLIGTGLALGAPAWGVIRARITHTRWVQAWLAPAAPLPASTPPSA